MSSETRTASRWSRSLFGLAAALTVLVAGTRASEAAEPGRCGRTKPPASKATASSASSKAPADAAKPTEAPSREAVGQAGVRAFIDPATGQLREPTPEEAAALARSAQRALSAQAAPVVLVRPDGAVGVQLGEDFMNDVVVRKNPDGTLSVACVPHPAGEKAKAAPAKPELEKE